MAGYGGFNFQLPGDFQLPPDFQLPGGMVNPAPVPLPPMPAPVAPPPAPMPDFSGINGILPGPNQGQYGGGFPMPQFPGAPFPMPQNPQVPMPQNPQVPMPQPMPAPMPQVPMPMPQPQNPQPMPRPGGGGKPAPMPMPAPYDDSGNPPRGSEPRPMPAPMPAPMPPQTFGQGPEVISDPAGSIGGTNPVFDMNNLDFSNLDLSNIPGYTPEPGGIESLAPTTPMVKDFVAPTGGIPMPGGGTFDPGMGGEGGAGNYFDNPLFSDPGLGGETGPGRRDNPPPNFTPGLTNPAAPAPAPYGNFQSNVDFMNQMAMENAQVGSEGQAVMPSYSYDPETNQYVRDSSAFGLTGDAAFTRYSPEEFQQEFGRTLAKQGDPGGSGPPRTFTDPNPAESGGTTPDTNNGLSPAQQAALDAFNEQYPNGYDPFSGGGFDPGIGGEGGGSGPGVPGPTPSGNGPGMGNGPGYTMGGTDASGNGNGPGGPGFGDNSGNADEEGSGNPYPFIPPGTDTSGMTPETLAGLNSFYEQYPNGFDLGSIGGSFPGGFSGGNFTPGGTTGTTTPVVPVDPVANLGGSDPATQRVAQDVNVSAASNYGLTGAVPTQPVDSRNPFARPESQQGIGSLGGG